MVAVALDNRDGRRDGLAGGVGDSGGKPVSVHALRSSMPSENAGHASRFSLLLQHEFNGSLYLCVGQRRVAAPCRHGIESVNGILNQAIESAFGFPCRKLF